MELSNPPEHLTRAFNRDLTLFTNHPDKQRALVFPPVNSFSRFCLHNLVKDNYPELTTFSVGSDKERRPVVCNQMTVAQWTLKNDVRKVLPPSGNSSPEILDRSSNQENVEISIEKNNEENGESVLKTNKLRTRNMKRPDRQVYVPPGSNRRSTLNIKSIQSEVMRPAKKPMPMNSSVTAINIFNSSTALGNLNRYPDQPYLSEIEAILGYVKPVNPYNDYLALETGCVTGDDIIENDLPNVVEIYDFPSDYKTDNLEDCLHRNLKLVNYYDLKWVDDTHALAVFTDAHTASQALNIVDSSIKFRPFWSASSQSVMKARMLKLTSESTTHKPRPDTSTVMAKRLLARALGMPSINAKQRETIKRGGPRSK